MMVTWASISAISLSSATSNPSVRNAAISSSSNFSTRMCFILPCENLFWRSWQHVVDDAPQVAPGSLQAALVTARGVGADVAQDGVAAELAAYFGSDDKRVGLAF